MVGLEHRFIDEILVTKQFRNMLSMDPGPADPSVS